MGELINGRTPEEIKAGLKACTTAKVPGYGCNIPCPYLNTPNCWLPVKSDALALIERLESERDAAMAKVPRWISVEERLPEHEHEVLVYTDRYGGRTEFAYYVRHLEAWYQNCCLLIPNVTHWMPLPEPPKEGE